MGSQKKLGFGKEAPHASWCSRILSPFIKPFFNLHLVILWNDYFLFTPTSLNTISRYHHGLWFTWWLLSPPFWQWHVPLSSFAAQVFFSLQIFSSRALQQRVLWTMSEVSPNVLELALQKKGKYLEWISSCLDTFVNTYACKYSYLYTNQLLRR